MTERQRTSASGRSSALPFDLDEQLKARFGFDHFQRGQREVIESVLGGIPTLAVMPTGAGKSLCYQLPAICLEGTTLVISPLISLMKDQVDSLTARGVRAAFLNSAQSASQQKEVIFQLSQQQFDLLYVAPERFQHTLFINVAKRINISLIAVDEAHCISRWGHNFRPHYARLGDYISELNPPRVIACTATATPQVRADIKKTLRFEDSKIHIAGFLRDNLYLEARLCHSERDRQVQLESFIEYIREKTDGAIVIYSTTVKKVERYAQVCIDLVGDEHVVMYHGRLTPQQRKQAQDRFMEGEANIVIATNAFGMGVDRSDVRAVVHLDLPGTLEGYYQEVGRAGRDREEAHCLLLYMHSDARTHQFLISKSNPSREHLQAVWTTLLRELGEGRFLTHEGLEQLLSHRDEPLETPLRILRSINAIRVDPVSNEIEINPALRGVLDISLLPLDLQTLAAQREHELDNLETMVQFAQSPRCRHTYLLQYFGEGAEGPCPEASRCDRCAPSEAQYQSPTEARGSITPDERRITQKALSGIARAKGVYGQMKVIEMLAGSTSSQLRETFLVELSTYGILSYLGQKDCKALINKLLNAGLCILAPRILKNGEISNYKTLQLTPEGLGVMAGKSDPLFRLDRDWIRLEKQSSQFAPPSSSRSQGTQTSVAVATSKSPRSPQTSPVERGLKKGVSSMTSLAKGDDDASGLRERLRRYRTTQARLREIPPYAVFSDSVLNALVEEQPQDHRSFLAIRGLGPSKWAQYGIEILAIINEE